MARFLHRNMSDFLRKWGIMVLAFCWGLGLLTGCSLYSDLSNLSSLMPGILRGSLSIVSLLISVFLPLLFSAFAVYISRPSLLFLICFLKACAVAVVSLGVTVYWDGGGWLGRILVLFHDYFASGLLLIFSAAHLPADKPLGIQDVISVFAPGLLAVLAEYYLFAPLLAEVI